MNRADELVAIPGVTFVASGQDVSAEMRLVRGVNIVTGSATHHAPGGDRLPVAPALDLLHRARVAAFAKTINGPGRGRQRRRVRGMAAYTAGRRLSGLGGDGVNGGIVVVRLARMTATAGDFRRPRVQTFDAVRLAADAMTGNAIGSACYAGGEGFLVKTPLEGLTRLIVTGGAVNLLIRLVMREILVVRRLGVTVSATETLMNAVRQRGGIDRDAPART